MRVAIAYRQGTVLGHAAGDAKGRYVDRQTGSSEALLELASRLAAGDEAAGDRLCVELAPSMRAAARRMLGQDAGDVDDVVQESMLGVLAHIHRRGGFAGDLVRFAVTVARNRCRNILIWRRRHPDTAIEPLADWLANPQRSALDALLEAEVSRVLQAGLDQLDQGCRQLLQWSYFEGQAMETIRQRIGLDTVQGVYYRRTVCLQRLAQFLNVWLARGS